MKPLAALLILFFPALCFAQPSLRGRVVDAKTGEPLVYATVVCYDGGKAMRAVTSATQGRFQLLAGEKPHYILVANMVGYAADTLRVTMPTQRTKADEVIEVGELRLRAGLEIDAVAVDGKRPLFEQRIDRYIYNVADDPDAKRLRMNEMMDKVPMLKVDPSGKLVYLEKESVQIIVDGEQHELLKSGKDYVMNFLRADLMGQIEIIPPGSPEYNNTNTIVNIKTIRRIPNGFAAQVMGTGNTDNAWTAGIDFVSKIRDKVIFGMGYSVNFANRPTLHNSSLRETFICDQTTDIQDNRRENSSDNLGHRINLNASTKVLGNNLNIGLRTQFSESNSYSANLLNRTDDNGAPKESQATEGQTTNRTKPRFNIDASYHHLISKGYQIEYTYNYTDNLSASDGRSRTDFSTTRPYLEHLTSSGSGTREHALRAVVAWRATKQQSGQKIVLPTHRFRGSVQYTDRKFTNTSERLRWDPLAMDYVPDYTYNSGMNYTQRVALLSAGYWYMKRKIVLSATATGNYERSHGEFLGEQAAPLRYEKFVLLPSVTARYLFNQKYSASVGYSMSVVRPDFAKLNPYVDATDSMNLRVGNPALQPERAHNVSFGFNRTFVPGRRVIIFNALYSRIDRAVEQITVVDPTSGISTTSYDNVGTRNNFTAKMLFVGIVAKKWCNLMGEVAYDYVNYQSGYSSARSVSQHGVSASASLNMPLWKSGAIYAEYTLLSDLGSPQSDGVNYTHTVRFGISQTLIKNRLFLSVSLDNPFESNRYIASSLLGANFRQTSYNERRGRIFGFNLRCNFGRFNEKLGANDDITSSDRNRATIPEN